MRDITEKQKIRFWASANRQSDDVCWLWVGRKDKHGYGVMKIGRAPRGAHRVSLALATGVPLGSPKFALHSCDNRLCVNPAHLRWGTFEDNMNDMKARKRGLGNTRRLSRSEALHVLESLKTVPQIAQEMGLEVSTVQSIRAGRNWKSLRQAPQPPETNHDAR